MEDRKLIDIYEATGTSVKDLNGISSLSLGFLDDQPYQYFKFDDINIPSMKLSNIIVAIGAFGGPVKFQAHVVTNHCFTHTRNRTMWTGPYLQIRVFNSQGRLLLDWAAGQINVICTSDFYFAPETKLESNEAYNVTLSFSASSYSNC